MAIIISLIEFFVEPGTGYVETPIISRTDTQIVVNSVPFVSAGIGSYNTVAIEVASGNTSLPVPNPPNFTYIPYIDAAIAKLLAFNNR